MLNRFSLKQASPLVALAGILCFSPAFAEDAVEVKGKPDPVRIKGDREHGDKGPAHDVVMPECLEKLKLTDKQKTQVKEIADKYEHSIEAVWARFKHRYRETIRTEAMFLTAVEDNLTEAQLKQIRDERRKTAHHGNHQSVSVESKAPEGKAPAKDAQPKAGPEQKEAPGIAQSTLDMAELNVDLTPDQHEKAEELHDSYYPRLRTLSREIERLHTQLISLEADELAEMETVLTKEQLAELKELRKSAPAPTRVAGRAEKTAE